MLVSKEKTKRHYIHSFLILAIMIGVGLIPAVEPVTQFGMQVLGVFLGCIYGWTIGQTIWPSVVALVILGCSGELTVDGVLASAYGNSTLLLVVWSVVFCVVIERCGLLDLIARFILSRKLATRGPWILCAMFYAASAILGALCCNALPPSLILWNIFYSLTEKLGIEKKSPYCAVVIIGVYVMADVGMVIMPYNLFSVGGFGMMNAIDPDLTINYAGYMMLMIILNVVIIPAIVLTLKYIVRVPIKFKEVDNLLEAKDLSLNLRQKIVLISLVFLFIGMLLPNVVSADLFIINLLARIGTNGWFILLSAMLMIIVIGGESIQDIGEAMVKAMPWGVYFLVATALYLSSLVVSESTGLSIVLQNVLAPVLSGKGTFALMALMLLFGMVLTNIINNFVCLSLFVPLGMTFVMANGGNPVPLVVLFCGILCLGTVMPAGSVGAAIMHGDKVWLTPSLIYKYATIIIVVVLVSYIIVGIPVANLLL